MGTTLEGATYKAVVVAAECLALYPAVIESRLRKDMESCYIGAGQECDPSTLAALEALQEVLVEDVDAEERAKLYKRGVGSVSRARDEEGGPCTRVD